MKGFGYSRIKDAKQNTNSTCNVALAAQYMCALIIKGIYSTDTCITDDIGTSNPVQLHAQILADIDLVELSEVRRSTHLRKRLLYLSIFILV